ncbi:hypothetical protein BGZ58_003130 [Dissophora ornata]|nr:hypothetical protein BGZ58_003130 [Dissophora ornata]
MKDPAGNMDAAAAKEPTGFHCDACDVTFHKEAKLMAHIAAHRSCPDCQYSASPSLVTDHRKLIHGSKDGPVEPSALSPALPIATAAKATAASVISTTTSTTAKLGFHHARNQGPKPIVNHELLHPLAPTLNTPEEIAAWIAQRRKAWPTEANILKKAQDRQDMIAKGQVIEEASSKGFNGKEKRRMNDNDRGSNNKRGQQSTTTPEVDGILAKKAKIEDAGSTTIMADGLVAYASSNELSDNEDADENMDPVKDAISSKDPSIMGKLVLPKERSTRPKKPCKYFLRGNCTRGDKCIFSHDPSLTNKVQKVQRVSPKKEVFRSRPSLLQMLLSGEIKQEKNKLLEAIRYIVENNFFEKREPSGMLVEELA